MNTDTISMNPTKDRSRLHLVSLAIDRALSFPRTVARPDIGSSQPDLEHLASRLYGMLRHVIRRQRSRGWAEVLQMLRN